MFLQKILLSSVYFSNFTGSFPLILRCQIYVWNETALALSKCNRFLWAIYFVESPCSIWGIRFLKLSRRWERWFNMIISHNISLWSPAAVNPHANLRWDKRNLALAELCQVKWDHSAALMLFASWSWAFKRTQLPSYNVNVKYGAKLEAPRQPSLCLLSSALVSPGSAFALTVFLSMRRLEEKSHRLAPGACISHNPLGEDVWLV